MTLKDAAPYLTMAVGVLGIIMYFDGRDQTIEDEAAQKTEITLAISSLKSEVSKMSASFNQAIDALKSQRWMDDGRTNERLSKLESENAKLEEEIDTLEKNILQRELNRALSSGR